MFASLIYTTASAYVRNNNARTVYIEGSNEQTQYYESEIKIKTKDIIMQLISKHNRNNKSRTNRTATILHTSLASISTSHLRTDK